MRVISLVEGQNHTLVSVIQKFNSFGDQLLEYILEEVSGEIHRRCEVNYEGEWVTNKEELKRWAYVHFKHVESVKWN